MEQSAVSKPLTKQDLCELFGIHRQTLWNWERDDPRFPKPFNNGRRKLYDPEAIRKYMRGK